MPFSKMQSIFGGRIYFLSYENNVLDRKENSDTI